MLLKLCFTLAVLAVIMGNFFGNSTTSRKTSVSKGMSQNQSSMLPHASGLFDVKDDKILKTKNVLSLVVPWLYFVVVAINMSNMPRYVNFVINKGDCNVSERSVKVYGYLSGFDSFFTFLTVNFIGCLSDSFGRRPFMLLSSAGQCVAGILATFARTPLSFFIAGSIDGLTSSMFAQAQAYITDCHNQNNNNNDFIVKPVREPRRVNDPIPTADATTSGATVSKKDCQLPAHIGESSADIGAALSRFQGIAVGMAYVLGAPLGGLLGKQSAKFPVYVAVVTSACNCALIATRLPESMPLIRDVEGKVVRRRVRWVDANPVGAIKMLFTRQTSMALCALTYFFLSLAHAGAQIIWVNYMQHRFAWSAFRSGSAFTAIGMCVSVLPPTMISALGARGAIGFGIAAHAAALFVIGCANSWHGLALGIPLLAVGASSLPLLLGHLTAQVKGDEIGALQGAADTLRSTATMIACPCVSAIFAHCIRSTSPSPGRHGMPHPGSTMFSISLCSAVALVLFVVDSITSRSDARAGKGA